MLKIKKFQIDAHCHKLKIQSFSGPEKLERKELTYVKQKNHLGISEPIAR